MAATTHKFGPLLIVAGAGTGKTTVVTERIKWFISKELAKPEEILALTFTEKAAKEMVDRVDVALPYGTFGLWISTFHSFCDRILRSEALHIGLNPHYKLMTEAETHLLVKKNFWKFKLDYFRPTGNPYKFIEGMIQHFSRLKDEDVSVGDYLKFVQRHSGERPKATTPESPNLSDSGRGQNDEETIKLQELATAYETYEKLKLDEDVMDFSDLIKYTLKLFRTRKNILTRYQKQFKQILVDEFQDTNYAQNELVKLLADGNITVVCDDDQSVYRFRGAAISNVLQFRKDFPKTKIITLTQNYRSTQEILDRSYELIQHNNPDRLEVQEKINKRLAASSKRLGGKIEMIYTDRVEDEAEQVIKKITGPNYSDYAILVRANNHSEPFVKALERAGIPYQFLGPGQLFKQSEVKDLIAYLKVLYDFTDNVSLYRVLSMEIFSFSQRDLIEVLNKAKKSNVSLFEELEKLIRHSGEPKATPESPNISDSGQARMTKFVDMVHKHQEFVAKETAGQILYFFLEDSGILKSLVDFDTNRAKNISKFFDKLKSFESTNKDASIFAVVDYLDLAMDMGESPLAAEIDWSENNAVNILTIHSAKGLEFPTVFLVNLVEGRFPSRERREQIPIPDNLIKEILPVGDFHLEEERRLFYVGMTRAKKNLFFSAANYYGEGKRERKLSPFVIEAGITPSLVTSHSSHAPMFEWKKSNLPMTNDQSRVTIDYLSYSAIEAFRICPLHYKLRYILKIPTPTTAPLSMGNSIHMALKDAYQNKKKLLDCLSEVWVSDGYTSKKHEQESLEKAKKFLTEYLTSDLHKKANPIYLEESFNFTVDKTLKIGGKIDRIDELPNGDIEIIDYKTGANVPTQKDIDSNLQMTIYALAATIKKPIEKVKLCFYYFDTASKVVTTRTPAQLEAAKKELLEIRSQIEHSDFQCSRGLLCKNCEYKLLCSS